MKEFVERVEFEEQIKLLSDRLWAVREDFTRATDQLSLLQRAVVLLSDQQRRIIASLAPLISSAGGSFASVDALASAAREEIVFDEPTEAGSSEEWDARLAARVAARHAACDLLPLPDLSAVSRAEDCVL